MAWVSRRAARTDRIRAAALLWGGWVIVTGLVFSYMNGIIHPYYMVALAPGIGALVGIGAMTLGGGVWARRHRRPGQQSRHGRPGQQGRPPEAAREKRHGVAARAVAAGTVLVTAVWSYVLLDRTPGWLPWLRWVVLLAGVLGAATMLAGPWLASVAAAGAATARAGHGGRAGRAGRLRAGHGEHRAHRRDPERGAGDGRVRWRRAGRVRGRAPGRDAPGRDGPGRYAAGRDRGQRVPGRAGRAVRRPRRKRRNAGRRPGRPGGTGGAGGAAAERVAPAERVAVSAGTRRSAAHW